MSTEQRGELRRHWRVLLGCTLGDTIGTVGLSFYTAGVFFAVLSQELGWTGNQLSQAFLLRSIAVAIAAPIAGALMDARGPWPVIVFSLCAEALFFALMGAMPAELVVFMALQMLLAFLGIGTTPLGFTRIIVGTFDKARGMALGISVSGLGLLAIAAPVLMTVFIQSYGWRNGYFALAAVVLIGGVPALLLIGPDAARAVTGTRRQTRPAGEVLRILQQPIFWRLFIILHLPTLFGSGLMVYMIKLLTDRGFSAEYAATVQSAMGVGILVGRFGAGFLMDRIFAGRVAALSAGLSGAGCLLLIAPSDVTIVLGGFLIALTIGSLLDIKAYLVAHYFGMASYGSIYGIFYASAIVGNGISTLLISTLVEGGSSTLMLYFICAIGHLAAALLCLTFRRVTSAPLTPQLAAS